MIHNPLKGEETNQNTTVEHLIKILNLKNGTFLTDSVFFKTSMSNSIKKIEIKSIHR